VRSARKLQLIRGWCFVRSTALLEGRIDRMPTRTKPARHIAFLALLSPAMPFLSTPASAGCTSTPIVAGLQVDCSDAIPPDPTNVPILIPAGNNRLNVLSGSYVSFEILGNGDNILSFSGGSTSGGVTTHDGADAFSMTGGTISGTLSQGDGVDSFTMSAGTVGTVDQGGGLDTFVMSGGTIVGAFLDGDFATITGGSIGSVDMNVGNNVFIMSGGTVIGNVITRQNNDTFVLLGGSIGGQVDLGNGTNNATVSGGSIGNGITTGTGTDTLSWNGGTVSGAIGLGDGADAATLANLGAANLAGTTLVDGGAGNDQLTFSGSSIANIARFQNWETVLVTNGSIVTLDSNLVLGGADTGTGSLTIDATSRLYAGGANNAIRPFTFGQQVLVTNSGIIDLANGSVGDTLTVVGNYIGAGGRLRLDTRLGSDGSPSDRLIMDTGVATGNTGLVVSNVGGAGAKTVANGILVVETQNGGCTAAGAFALAAPVVAGPYEYSLYRGAADGSAPENWYLRSTLDSSLPDYRPEVSLYSALPAMTLLYGRQLLNTPQERLDDPAGTHRGRWSRVIGQRGEHDGHALGIYGSGPQYDYNFWAVQAGTDLFRSTDAQGARNRAGAFFAVGNGFGDVTHFDRTHAGQDNFMAYSWGGYWTHYLPGAAYIDTALLGTWYDAAGQSTRLPRMTTQGLGFGSSLEGGYPLRFAGGFIVEPQAQVAYQTINLSNTSDAAAQIRFDDVNSLAGRLGVRFSRSWGMTELFGTSGPGVLTGWLRPNFWYEFLGNPKTSFSSETKFIPFQADIVGPTLEVNAGFNAQIAQDTAIYANASYLVGLGGSADGNAFDGKVGFKVGW
jgi:type V secretory pathway adhesin AidA